MPDAADPVRVLELRSVRGTGGGPEKTILLGAAQAAPDIRVTVCYVRDARDTVFGIDERAADAGVEYVEIRERHSLDLRAWRELERLVRERHIDIVHAHEYKSNAMALFAARRTGVTPLATAHGWTGHSARERMLYYPADKQILRRFPLVIAVSSQVKTELVAHGCRDERVRVLLNGIDPQAFRRDPAQAAPVRRELGVPEGALVIGSVGRLEPQKRFDLLIQAFGAIRARHPHANLLIAGEGSERARLDALVASAGLSGSCRLVGHVADVRPFHHALDLFVQSSTYEGTPNVVLEAMALETPLVVTDVGGTAELVRDGEHGIVVPPGSAPSLSAAVERALGDAEGRRARVRAARRRVETDLSFDARLRRLEAIYRELAVRRRAA